MKFFKNHTVAVILTVLVIAGCCVYGFVTRPNETAADLAPLEYGRENYAAYLGWIDDGANILSDDTEREVAVVLAAMDQAYGSIVALVTETDAGGMTLADRAVQIANDAELSGVDMILLIDTGTDNWYLQPGQDIEPRRRADGAGGGAHCGGDRLRLHGCRRPCLRVRILGALLGADLLPAPLSRRTHPAPAPAAARTVPPQPPRPL